MPRRKPRSDKPASLKPNAGRDFAAPAVAKVFDFQHASHIKTSTRLPPFQRAGAPSSAVPPPARRRNTDGPRRSGSGLLAIGGRFWIRGESGKLSRGEKPKSRGC